MNFPKFLSRPPQSFGWALAALAAAPIVGLAQQYPTPHTIAIAGDVAATLGGTTFVNHGLVGVGRISASAIDTFGETFGSVSGLQITNWKGQAGGAYTGTFNILPDRGYNNNNSGGFFSDYAARIQKVNFSFTPYVGSSNIGGTDIVSRIAAQAQITFTSAISGVKLTYPDPISGAGAVTSGLDPGTAGNALIFGQTLPYVINYTGQPTPGAANQAFTGINKLAIDAEGLALKADGSGYVSDEYGANVYYFNASRQIVGVIVPPSAVQPHTAGALNFISTAAAEEGRRNNQGLEGVALSPDGRKLFTLLQSATVQDSGTPQQNRLNTRLAVYDVSAAATPPTPVAEYVLQLPTYTSLGTGAVVNATAAQSEIVALDDHRILVLARDANGLGSVTAAPSVVKVVLLVDLTVGTPTNIAGTRDGVGAKVTTSIGVIDPAITPLSATEVLNMLNSDQLAKFNIQLDLGGGTQVTKQTLGEKWEGMSLVPANDPAAPNDYFLFIANDNDFLTSQGKMVGPGGTSLIDYNAFISHPAVRLPAPVSPSTANENDTMFLAFRVTITPGVPNVAVPTPAPSIGQPPVVKISGKKKVVTDDPDFTVQGKVADSDGNAQIVQVKVGNGKYRNVKLGKGWKLKIALEPGKNVVHVRSIDASGLVSKVEKLVIVRE